MPPENATAVMRSVSPPDLGLPERPVSNADLVRGALQHAAARANVLAPLTQIDYIPPDYQIALRVVAFDAVFSDTQVKERSNGTFYAVDGGKLALHRSALDQLAAAAGMTWQPHLCKRIDDGRQKHLWSWQMAATLRTFDGTVRQIVRSRTVDLRDGSAEIDGWTDKRLVGARTHGAALAESKAANRVVRAALGIKGGYTKAEAAKPFVFPVLIWSPPPSAEVSRMIAAKELGLVEQLYGAGGAPSGSEQVVHGAAYRSADVIEATVAADAADDEFPFDDDPAAGGSGAATPAEDCCAVCGVQLPQAVLDFSVRRFRRPLCRQHQG